MGRLLSFAILVFLAVWLARRALARIDAGDSTTPAKPVEDLVRCAHCGLLLPRAEARERRGAIYCTEEHARLGPARR